jgi:hypothetical protein
LFFRLLLPLFLYSFLYAFLPSSLPSFTSFLSRSTSGFIANPKRFNVAITRAMALNGSCHPPSLWRCSRARALPHYKRRAGTFKRVAETGPRLANVVGEGRLSLTDFLPEAEK